MKSPQTKTTQSAISLSYLSFASMDKTERLHLYRFPNEILCRIIDELDSAGTASFALSSKAMFEISRPAIEKHRAEKYATINFGPPSYDGVDRFEGYHPLFLLDKIISDPSIRNPWTRLEAFIFHQHICSTTRSRILRQQRRTQVGNLHD